MTIRMGNSKPMEEVTLQDMLEYPIWTFALDEEDIEGQDETWQKPIYSTNVLPGYIAVYILLKIEQTDQYVSADLDIKRMTLADVALWQDDEWIPIHDVEWLSHPLTLISIPTIKGVENMKFIISK